MKEFLPEKGIVLRVGEAFLKGKNRGFFIHNLEINIGRLLSKYVEKYWLQKSQGRFYIRLEDKYIEDGINLLSRLFGIVSLSPVIFCKKEIEDIKRAIDKLIQYEELSDISSFKIEAKRADKKFPYNSLELNKLFGEYVIKRYNWEVDLHNPQLTLYIEIGLKDAFVYTKVVRGEGGLPVGVSGKGVLLLSGGIDSPVAGYLMQKRGVNIEALYFHSPPYVGEGAKDKVISIVKKLAFNQESIRLHIIPFTKIQEAFKLNCKDDYLVILYRRAMIRLANRLAKEIKAKILITGESLGQVASQTVDNLNCIGEVSQYQILRPLIGFDKSEIIELSKRIGTYEISIQPFEDCCSLFVPKHPQTKGDPVVAKREEEKVKELSELLDQAYNNKETIVVYG